MTPKLTDFIEGGTGHRPNFLSRRTTYRADVLDAAWKDTDKPENGPRRAVPYEDANLVGSVSSPCGVFHEPVIDIDFPAHLEPSTTEGHFHLYLNKEVEWDKFLKVLEAMRDAGLVEEGYYEMTKRRGQAFVRRPGVHKTDAERYVRYPENDDDDWWEENEDARGLL